MSVAVRKSVSRIPLMQEASGSVKGSLKNERAMDVGHPARAVSHRTPWPSVGNSYR